MSIKDRDRYIGAFEWEYSLHRVKNFIRLENPSGNRREDEAYVRLLIRQKLGVKRLPPKTKVMPASRTN